MMVYGYPRDKSVVIRKCVTKSVVARHQLETYQTQPLITEWVCLCVRMCVWTCVCQGVCVYVCIGVCVCKRDRAVYVCMCVLVFKYVCTCVGYTCVHVHGINMRMRMFVCKRQCVFVCARVARACVCLRALVCSISVYVNTSGKIYYAFCAHWKGCSTDLLAPLALFSWLQ